MMCQCESKCGIIKRFSKNKKNKILKKNLIMMVLKKTSIDQNLRLSVRNEKKNHNYSEPKRGKIFYE